MADDKPLSRWQREHRKPAPPPVVRAPEPEPEPEIDDDEMAQFDLGGLTDEPAPDPNDSRAQFVRMIMDSMDEYQKEKAREKS